MKTLTCSFMLFIGLSSCEAQRDKAWKEDLDFWVAAVKEQHYVYKKVPLPISFQEQLDRIKANINSYSDQRMAAEILGLSALLGDGHTYVLPWGGQWDARALPFRFYGFADGLFIISVSAGYEDWIGRKVLQIGSVSSEELMKRVSRFVSRDNDQGIKWIGPFLLPFEGMLQAMDVDGNGRYTITFEDAGKKTVKEIPVVAYQPTRGVPKLIAPRSVSAPLYLTRVNENFWIKSIPTNTLYVQFNQVMDDPGESLRQFADRLADSIKATHPKKLIIDVRHNNGGNADLLGPLLETLQQFKKQPGNDLYILTGRNTFSACQIFISKADRMLKPIFAGELSSSRPNFIGEENAVILPNSKTICSISNRYHESIPGDNRQSIEPEIKIVITSSDYFAGRDPVLEAVLKRP